VPLSVGRLAPPLPDFRDRPVGRKTSAYLAASPSDAEANLPVAVAETIGRYLGTDEVSAALVREHTFFGAREYYQVPLELGAARPASLHVRVSRVGFARRIADRLAAGLPKSGPTRDGWRIDVKLDRAAYAGLAPHERKSFAFLHKAVLLSLAGKRAERREGGVVVESAGALWDRLPAPPTWYSSNGNAPDRSIFTYEPGHYGRPTPLPARPTLERPSPGRASRTKSASDGDGSCTETAAAKQVSFVDPQARPRPTPIAAARGTSPKTARPQASAPSAPGRRSCAGSLPRSWALPQDAQRAFPRARSVR